MHNKQIEETIRDVLQKTYEDGQRNGKGGLGYSERAFKILTTLTSQIRQEEQQRIIKYFKKVESEKWPDANHCTCLGYAIYHLENPEDDGMVYASETKKVTHV